MLGRDPFDGSWRQELFPAHLFQMSLHIVRRSRKQARTCPLRQVGPIVVTSDCEASSKAINDNSGSGKNPTLSVVAEMDRTMAWEFPANASAIGAGSAFVESRFRRSLSALCIASHESTAPRPGKYARFANSPLSERYAKCSHRKKADSGFNHRKRTAWTEHKPHAGRRSSVLKQTMSAYPRLASTTIGEICFRSRRRLRRLINGKR